MNWVAWRFLGEASRNSLPNPELQFWEAAAYIMKPRKR